MAASQRKVWRKLCKLRVYLNTVIESNNLFINFHSKKKKKEFIYLSTRIHN